MFKDECDTGRKRHYIPNYVRKLLRKKLKLSKNYMESNDWKKNYEIHENISEVEDLLEDHFNKRNHTIERKAINDIQHSPKEFLSIQRDLTQIYQVLVIL